MKKLAVSVMTIVMAAAMSVNAFAASKITLAQAYTKALKDAGTTKSKVYDVDKEYDDGVYEIEFTRRSDGVEFSYEYSRTGTLIEKSVDYNRTPVYGAKKLSKSDAKTKVRKFGNFKKSTVSDARVYLTRDDGEYIYEVNFSTDNYRYEYDVHARTGKILEWSKERR